MTTIVLSWLLLNTAIVAAFIIAGQRVTLARMVAQRDEWKTVAEKQQGDQDADRARRDEWRLLAEAQQAVQNAEWLT